MLDKKYNHTEVEKGRYENWLKHNYFECGDTSKKPTFFACLEWCFLYNKIL